MWLALLCYPLWLWWLGHYPLALSSDDALNFARGIERFSVLEFRPHFPGYPAFIVLARALQSLTASALANVQLSLLATTLLPLAAAAVAGQLVVGAAPMKSAQRGTNAPSSVPAAQAAGVAALLLMSQPLLWAAGLSGLSDPLALLWLLLLLLAGLAQRSWLAGLLLGLLLATRPAYLPLVVSLPLWPHLLGFARPWRALLYASAMVLLVALLSLGFVWWHDGAAYFSEGLRFSAGHFQIWGNTSADAGGPLQQWLMSLQMGFGWPLLVAAAGLMALMLLRLLRWRMAPAHSVAAYLLLLMALGYGLWMLWGQNPANLRHSLPLLLLVLILLAVQLAGKMILWLPMVVVLILNGAQRVQWTQPLPPLQQALQRFAAEPQSQWLGSNYGVNLLTAALPQHAVVDMYYPSSQVVLAQQAHANKSWRLSASPVASATLITEFSPRFPGERRLYLYQLSNNAEQKQ